MEACDVVGHDWLIRPPSLQQDERVWVCRFCDAKVKESLIAEWQRIRKEIKA